MPVDNKIKKIKVGILGATGTVGQKFIVLLKNHSWFEVTLVAASPRSAGKPYGDAVKGRWVQGSKIPTKIKKLPVYDAIKDMKKIASEVDLVFSCLSAKKSKIIKIESSYAKLGVGVVSTSSANRLTPDVPMVIPEINPDHIDIINYQRKKRGWDTGFIAVKPNCSIQSYVPPIHALRKFQPTKILVSTYQSISGAGKTFETWPEMEDNVIPFIGGEEEKSEVEPLKVWGNMHKRGIKLAKTPKISAHCIRVAASDGHLATVNVSFKKNPTKKQILDAWKTFKNPISGFKLPTAPKTFLKYFEEDDRPQTALDRDFENGMGITMGRLRKDNIFDWKFSCLSHNTLRGAAGGALLMAELLYKKGYVNST